MNRATALLAVGVTFDLWGHDVPRTAAERAETLSWFLSNEYGVRPAAADKPHVAFAPLGPDVVMMDGVAVRTRVQIKTAETYGTNAFAVTAFLPATARGPIPAFLLICNRDPGENIDPARERRTEFWPAEEIVRRGYAAIAFYNGDVAPDCAVGNSEGVFACYEDVAAWRKSCFRPHDAWGTLSAWAWGASRVMDWIVREPRIDAARVAVVGHSRGGKTALLAAVTDTRFAMACVNNSGCSGAKVNRLDLPQSESIAAITRSFPYWFCSNYRMWVNRDKEMPYDQHQFLALMAPRLVAVGSAADDAWAGPAGEDARCRLARADCDDPRKVHYHIRPGGHGLTLVDWTAYLDFADRQGWHR